MKKIITIIFCFFGIAILNAKEINIEKYENKQLEFYCDNELYNFKDYIESNNKIILEKDGNIKYIYGNEEFDFNKENSTYNNKDIECYDLTIDEKLNIENEFVEVIEKESIDEKLIISKYDTYKSLIKGYVLNTDKYNEKEHYYEKVDNDYNEIDNEDIDKDNINEYYVIKHFKKVSSLEKDKSKKYYELINDEEFIISEKEINKNNAFDIYESVSEYKFNKKEFILTEEEINALEEKYILEDNSYLDYEIINDNLYYKVSIYDEDDNYISCRYYSVKDKELFEEINVKEIQYYKGYYILNLINENKYAVYDNEMNKIYEYSVNDNYQLYNMEKGYNKLFLNFIDNETNNEKTILIEKYYETDYKNYIIVLCSVVAIILVLGIITKKK